MCSGTINLIDQIRPRALMIENVRGLLDPQFNDYREVISKGTEQTLIFCIQNKKRHKLLDIETVTTSQAAVLLHEAVLTHNVEILNVAGPRFSDCPAIYDFVKLTIRELLS